MSFASANDQRAIADAIRLRSELGFRADRDYVEQLLSGGALSSKGDAITLVEEKELARRENVRQRLEPAIEIVRNNPFNLAGAFFDQSVGDMKLVIRTLPETPDALIETIEAKAPTDSTIEFRPAQWSEAALASLRDEMFGRFSHDLATTAFVDPITNRVVMTVSEASLGPARSAIGSRADEVELSSAGPLTGTACSSRTSCTVPWRGGTAISNVCTWGFNARPVTTSTTRYLLTAGHCTQLSDAVTHNGSTV